MHNLQSNIDGKRLTSMRVGGVVRYFAQPTTADEIQGVLDFATKEGLPLAVIGGGSDLLLSDYGFNGILVQPFNKTLRELPEEEYLDFQEGIDQLEQGGTAEARYRTENKAGFLQLQDATLSPHQDRVLVEMGAAVPWGLAVSWSLRQNLGGLHLFARIPCQVGGAVYNNIHAQQYLLSEFVVAVKAVERATATEKVFFPAELKFGYDTSIFHERPCFITSVILSLPRKSLEQTAINQQQYLDWTKKKSEVQPSGPNAGSTFKNISHEQAEELGQEAVAAAWYIDQAGMKDYQIGGMQVYPGHANFIINTGEGTQGDFLVLVTNIRQKVQEQFGILLEPEVECINENGDYYRWSQTAFTGDF
jgi:UDP-N-acetylmuramate dehydrogenase